MNGQTQESGKLMLIDPFDYDTMQIFFDDSFDEFDIMNIV